MDVEMLFLYGKAEEEILIEQPEGLQDTTNRACNLNKALYGLKQAPRSWYETLANFLKKENLGLLPFPLTLEYSQTRRDYR